MLFKVTNTSLVYAVTYVKAKDFNDCLFKIRKYYESQKTALSDDLINTVKSIELVSKNIVE
jgi:hypothetical protein